MCAHMYMYTRRAVSSHSCPGSALRPSPSVCQADGLGAWFQVLVLGLEELANIRNVERLKKDLRVSDGRAEQDAPTALDVGWGNRAICPCPELVWG